MAAGWNPEIPIVEQKNAGAYMSTATLPTIGDNMEETEDNVMEFDINRPEQARWLAITLSEFQAYTVKFYVSKNQNIVYIRLHK